MMTIAFCEPDIKSRSMLLYSVEWMQNVIIGDDTILIEEVVYPDYGLSQWARAPYY